mgnify:FL=1
MIFDKKTGSFSIVMSSTVIIFLAQEKRPMTRISKVTLTALICVIAMIGSQSLYALTEAAKAAAAAAADTAKNSGVTGQKAANDIAGAAYGVSEKSEENLASAIACLVFNESSRAELEGVTPETAAKAAAVATSAPPGSVIYVCDPALAFDVTTSTSVNGVVIAGVAALAGISAAAGGSSGNGGDSIGDLSLIHI